MSGRAGAGLLPFFSGILKLFDLNETYSRSLFKISSFILRLYYENIILKYKHKFNSDRNFVKLNNIFVGIGIR
jgi:hypothetical protein